MEVFKDLMEDMRYRCIQQAQILRLIQHQQRCLSHPPLCQNMTGRPASFLSLPHELRQDILLRTWRNRFPYDWRKYRFMFASSYRESSQRTKKLEKWVATLRDVDVQIAGDMDYVERKWREGLWQILRTIPNYIFAIDALAWQQIVVEHSCRRARISPYGRLWVLDEGWAGVMRDVEAVDESRSLALGKAETRYRYDSEVTSSEAPLCEANRSASTITREVVSFELSQNRRYVCFLLIRLGTRV